ncbi:hypothetical protein EK21DRAFT_116470 [Setomelanomma holmii]|uniref:Uncharacterized protein n=1 Tax=Setomelanomma holmii TaxID=210430 RepID=A0A9P4H2D4_9PLEO|nr:hypothetical protein EK21DRAFT_116470 [Setomelanomma holmii]
MYNSVGFQTLPLELRNAIYEYCISDCLDLNVHYNAEAAVFDTLRRRLPLCLCVNHQIREEATKALLHLLDVLPENFQLPNVRRIEFTRAQHCYAPIQKDGRVSTQPTVHELAIRCPNLADLILPISMSMLRTRDSLISAQRAKSIPELALSTGFSRLSELTRLRNLRITCAGCRGAPDVIVFKPLEALMVQEKARNCMLEIDITPNARKSGSPECVERREGCIRYIFWWDFFG